VENPTRKSDEFSHNVKIPVKDSVEQEGSFEKSDISKENKQKKTNKTTKPKAEKTSSFHTSFDAELDTSNQSQKDLPETPSINRPLNTKQDSELGGWGNDFEIGDLDNEASANATTQNTVPQSIEPNTSGSTHEHNSDEPKNSQGWGTHNDDNIFEDEEIH